MRLFDFLFPPREDELVLRDLSPDEFLSRMHPVIVDGTNPPVTALLPFNDPFVRAAVHEVKYHGSESAFILLSSVLAEYLRTEEWLGPVVLVPVPLSKERLRERRFNQAEEIASRAARETDTQMDTSLIERVRDTKSQVALSGEARRENVRGAFRATGSASASATYLLFDDVVTSGATLAAAADALKEAGAVHISPIALSH